MAGSAITEIIARNRSDDHVLKAHPAGGLSDARRFISLEREGPGGGDSAEMAGASAAVAGDHEGRRALAPTFPVVRAAGALTNGVQLQFVQ
jgi:hypothetical protein